MSPLSKSALPQASYDTATGPTTVPSLRFKPTIAAWPSSRVSGWPVSSSNTTSTGPHQTGFSTRVASTGPSAALTTPLYYTNHSTLAVATPASTHMLPGLYTIRTSETGLSSPTSGLTMSTAATMPTLEQDQAMSLQTKVGLALIPIAVGLCAWGLVLLFLWRRRDKHESHHRIDSFPASLPEKFHSLEAPSLSSSVRSHRIFTMAAFYSRDNRNGHAEVDGQSPEDNIGVSRSTTPPPGHSPSGKKNAASDEDSPIDGGSPFQLKHGNTRRSLGLEISELWPSPPPSAWARRQDVLDQLPSSKFGRDMSLSMPKPLSSRSPRRNLRDMNRPSAGEYWPLI